MPQQSNMKFITSSIFLFCITSVYLYFIYILTHQRLWLEIGVSIIFPAIFFALNKTPHFKARVKQLFFIESSYNVLAILSIASIFMSLEMGNIILAYGFVGFFVIQALGFIAYQIKRKKYTSVFLTLSIFSFIMAWFFSLNNEIQSVIDGEGRLLMWGIEAPLSVKIMYIIWVLNPMFVDTKYLPKISQAIVHIPSLILCWWSGEFFHVRLLTACHLFMLDGIFGYGRPEFLGPDFCQIPERHMPFYTRVIQPIIQYASIATAITLIIASSVWGLDLK